MLDKQLAAFLEEGLAIHIATRNERLEPGGARVTAVLVDEDGTHLEAFIPENSASLVLPDLEANGQAALVFTRPVDERGCQVKGVFTGWRHARDDERGTVIAQWTRFRDVLELVGFPYQASKNWPTWPAVAIRVRLNALFNQTPGPGAGAPLS